MGRERSGRFRINAGGARLRDADSILPIRLGRSHIAMKFLIISFAIISCAFAQFGGGFRPFPRPAITPKPYPIPQQQPQFPPQFQPQQPQYQPQNQFRPSGSIIPIRSQSQDSSPDGSYQFSYETDNGISVSESGSPKGVATPDGQAELVQGRYSYVAPDGTPITVEYYADETGFHATGAHIPTPPPIPEAIQRAIASLPPSNEGQYQEEQYNNRQYNQNPGGPFRRF
ncbi:endocuticle structural glycoprotein SgAbd-2 [Microplitis demolitor]|uniref:endocuticle structural glycoprotein SgAbd-2 n=1 Tax=Microplitis demolitor TaxID=69319 RepID=UPI0004CD7340|nr:endocuticle structural glycoprotein SgAbd-2 [Microplitis demolitor]